MEAQVPIGAFIKRQYNYLFQDEPDPRTQEWFLASSPWPTTLICFGYIYVCTYLGPRLMWSRKPFELRGVMLVYNAIQVICSLLIFIAAGFGGWFNGYNVICQPIEKTGPRGLLMANVVWWFFMSKFLDFLDTFFFILRKKYDQISFLHISHHGVMPFACWYAVRFLSGGHVSSIGILNAFVHVVMYFYYFMAGLGPRYQKYLWWKRYLTIIQMVQFVIMFIHQGQLFFIPCDFPSYPRYWGLFFGPVIIGLFYHFYQEAYYPERSHVMLPEEKIAIHERIAQLIPCHNFQSLSDDNIEEDKKPKNSVKNGFAKH